MLDLNSLHSRQRVARVLVCIIGTKIEEYKCKSTIFELLLSWRQYDPFHIIVLIPKVLNVIRIV